MKNKEEPSVDLRRGNPCEQADLYSPDCDGPQTTGSLSRPGLTVAAHTEQPALSDFSESLMERVVDPANIETAWKNVKANRGAPGPDGITIAEFPEWFRPRWKTIRQQLLDGTYLTEELRLVVNQAKSRIVSCDQFEYLGFSFKGNRGTIQVSEKSTQKFKHRIRELTGRSRGISMDHRFSLLRSYVRGWMGYYGLAAQLKLFDRLDQWLRRRIRMCYWKQWRRPKRRREMLIELGVPTRQAIRHARSRKGPWHMAKTIASGVGMTNAWLTEQGLLSLKTLWASLARIR